MIWPKRWTHPAIRSSSRSDSRLSCQYWSSAPKIFRREINLLNSVETDQQTQLIKFHWPLHLTLDQLEWKWCLINKSWLFLHQIVGPVDWIKINPKSADWSQSSMKNLSELSEDGWKWGSPWWALASAPIGSWWIRRRRRRCQTRGTSSYTNPAWSNSLYLIPMQFDR